MTLHATYRPVRPQRLHHARKRATMRPRAGEKSCNQRLRLAAEKPQPRLHCSQQFSTVALTTSSAAIAERYAYSAYGAPTVCNTSGMDISASAEDNRVLYTGREWDEELELYHFRARLYDSVVGRFLGRDPIFYKGSKWLLYSFLNGNPNISMDPSGLDRCVASVTGGEHFRHGVLVIEKCDADGNLVGYFTVQHGDRAFEEGTIENWVNKYCLYAPSIFGVQNSWVEIRIDEYAVGSLPDNLDCFKDYNDGNNLKTSCVQDKALIDDILAESNSKEQTIFNGVFCNCQDYARGWANLYTDFEKCKKECAITHTQPSSVRGCLNKCQATHQLR